jgi:hypothetical protein
MHTPVILRAFLASLLVYVLSCSAASAAVTRDSLWNVLLHRYVITGDVSYTGFKADPAFADVIRQFTSTDPDAIQNQQDRLAFWINAYNLYTIKLICDHLPVPSIKAISAKPWDDAFITIHGTKYSLNNIEENIIRKKFHEPRIHFALVCAAKSCPPLRSEAYVGAKLDKQLADNGAAFFRDPKKNRYDAPTGTIFLSPIFGWYKEDFIAKSGSVQQFVKPYLNAPAITSQTPIRYTDYDWSLNGH